MNGTEFNFGDALKSAIDLTISFSTDFFAFIALAAFIAAFAFYFGRDRIVSLLAGIYVAIPLYLAFPYSDILSTPLLHVALYVGFVIVAMIAFSGLSAYIAGGSIGFIKMTILAVVTAGLLIAISIHILPVEQIYTFSVATKTLFAGNQAFFLWLVAPLIAIYFFGRG